MCIQDYVTFLGCGHAGTLAPDFFRECIQHIAEGSCPGIITGDQVPYSHVCHCCLLLGLQGSGPQRPSRASSDEPVLTGYDREEWLNDGLAIPEIHENTARGNEEALIFAPATFLDPDTGVTHHYHEADDNPFSDPLRRSECMWLFDKLEVFETAILYFWACPDVPDPTWEEVHLIIHMRNVILRHTYKMHLGLDLKPEPEGLVTLSENLAADLPGIIRPVALSEITEDPNCMICLEKFGEVSDEYEELVEPVRLPCDHIYCFSCLNKWCLAWDEVSELSICTLCRMDFEMVERAEVPIPIWEFAPWWLKALRAEYD